MTDQLVKLLQGLENRRVSGLLEGDFDAVEAMLSDKLIYGHSTGLVDDKASLMKSIRAGTVEYLSIDSEIGDVTAIRPDVLAASGVITIRARVNGEEGRFGGRFMAVWAKEDEHWLLQALQATNAGAAGD